MNALSLEDISFSYDGKRTILCGLSLAIEKGETAAITGPSGSGKSTLAMTACGIIPKSLRGEFSGIVRVLGEDIKDKEIYNTAQSISMVFQDPESQLFAPSAVDEVAFAPENLCFEQRRIIERIESSFEAVGISGFADRSPHTLSGGQQQLVALASILSLDPEIIILDEITAQVDEQGAKLIEDAIKTLKLRGKTVIIIEHEGTFSGLYDAVYRIENGKIAL